MEIQPVKRQTSDHSKPSVRTAATLLLVVIGLMFTVGSIIQAIHFDLGLIITQWVLILLPALWYLNRYSPFPAALARFKPLPLKYIPIIVLLAVCTWFTLAFIESLMISGLTQLGFEPLEKIPSPETAARYAVYIFTIAISAGVCEEILFRGAIMPSLEQHGLFPALLFSAMLFALMHMSFLNIFSTFILGLVIGLVVIKTGSLFAGILYHSLNNFIAVSFMYAYGRYDLAETIAQNETFATVLFLALAGFGLIGAAAGLLLLQRHSVVGPLWRNRSSWLPRSWLNWATALITIMFLIIAALELLIGFGLFDYLMNILA